MFCSIELEKGGKKFFPKNVKVPIFMCPVTYEGDVLTSVRRSHEGETTQICCPISSYNSSMGGVDLNRPVCPIRLVERR